MEYKYFPRGQKRKGLPGETWEGLPGEVAGGWILWMEKR